MVAGGAIYAFPHPAEEPPLPRGAPPLCGSGSSVASEGESGLRFGGVERAAFAAGLCCTRLALQGGTIRLLFHIAAERLRAAALGGTEPLGRRGEARVAAFSGPLRVGLSGGARASLASTTPADSLPAHALCRSFHCSCLFALPLVVVPSVRQCQRETLHSTSCCFSLMMDGLGSGGLPCPGSGVPYGGPVGHSVADQLQHGGHADAAAAASQQHQVSTSPHVGVHAVSAYTEQSGGGAVAAAAGASPPSAFGGDMSAGGAPPAVVSYSSLAAAAEAPPSHYPAAESLDHFVGGGVACAEAYHPHHAVRDGLPLEPPPPHSAVAGDDAGVGCGGAPTALGSPSPALDVATAASCGGGGGTSEPGGHPAGAPQGRSPPSHFGGAPEDGSTCGGNVSSPQQQPRVGGEAAMREASADHPGEAGAAGAGPPPPSGLTHSHHHPMAAYHTDVPPEQQGENRSGGPSSSAGGPHHPPESSPGSGAVGMGGAGEPSAFGVQGGGAPRSGIEKYLQWLDAIHTACSKLDDLCSKLDRSFPNATREWDATSPGIRGARQLFQMYATAQQATQQQMHAMGGPSSLHDDVFSANPRKRPRRDPAHAHSGMGPAAGGGGLPPQSPGGTGLAHEFAGAAISMPGGGGAASALQQMHQTATGAAIAAAMGIGAGAYGPPGGVGMGGMEAQLKAAVGAGGGASPGPSLSLPLTQPCSSPLPGTANVLPPAGVPVTASLADGAEYEYLLDFPEQEAPDPGKPGDLKCDVAGVYWDKRSWIASWYEGGKRYYKSFSAKTHGFYRSKYWAIKVRLSKVQSHALAGKGLKARATAA
ncbi:hypothetical protein Esti_005214 [Eimeria stiedai]